MIRTLIVAAASQLRRANLAAMHAAADIDIVGTGADVASGLRLAEKHRPDVIVLSEATTGEGVTAHIPGFRTAGGSAAIIILGAATDLGHVERCASAGAAGYVVDDAPKELVAAIRSTTLHGIWLSPRIAAQLVVQERTRLKARDVRLGEWRGSRPTEREFADASPPLA